MGISREEYQRYRNYINSIEWLQISEYIKKLHDYRCDQCDKREAILDIHHETYEHLYDELNHLYSVSVLCRSCHKEEHWFKLYEKAKRILNGNTMGLDPDDVVLKVFGEKARKYCMK